MNTLADLKANAFARIYQLLGKGQHLDHWKVKPIIRSAVSIVSQVFLCHRTLFSVWRILSLINSNTPDQGQIGRFGQVCRRRTPLASPDDVPLVKRSGVTG